MIGNAQLSGDGLLRYRLDRVWDERCERCLFVMLNPSTADATTDDPTIRRCIAFAKAWGYGGLTVMNLFALRATDPRELADADRAMMGAAANRHMVLTAATSAPVVVCAWGAHGRVLGQGTRMLELLREAGHGPKLRHLGLTKEGHPRHPLYLRADLMPMAFPGDGPTQEGTS